MENKKYILFIGLLCILASTTYAQVGTNYDVLDSSHYSNRKLPQFNEFRNNAYPFPPKPRNLWEIGIKGGLFTINGDVPALPSIGFGAHIRRALGYVVSLRLEYMYGIGKGLGYGGRTAGYSDPFARYAATGTPVFDNYKSTVHQLSLESIFALNNINFHKAKSNVSFYAIAGIGLIAYQTKVDALNGSNALYAFNQVPQGGFDNKKDTRDYLKNTLNIGDSYESDAEKSNKSTLGDNTLTPSGSFGAGIAFRLGKRINLAIEDKVSFSFNDLLDGQRWQNANGATNRRILTSSNDNINYLTVGLNFNIGKKTAVEPLYWLNPLDYAYSELNAPKHMKFPKPILDDADGDGITDQFDQEPNTPAGSAVDSHGVSRDTDGDGVPDNKDKELITPTQCQPVDADGVGKCPEPACCTTLDSLIKAGGIRNCNLGNLPSVSFTGRGTTLTNDAKAVLTSVAESLRNNPNCKVSVVGYGESSKAAQQLSWDRVNTVINHLVEKEGISTDRFIFKYGEAGGDANTVDIREASNDEGGPNTVPAPHPNLRRRK